MLDPQRLCPNPTVWDDSHLQPVLTRNQAEKIVNIAGIRSGDNVLVAGAVEKMIEDAVKGLGARFINGIRRHRPGMAPKRADVALCFYVDGQREPIPSMRNLCRCLRPGGRVVVWAAPVNNQPPSILKKHLQEAAAASGFTSMIVGQLPGEKGRVMIVATGILRYSQC
jgi:hypothetical protein